MDFSRIFNAARKRYGYLLECVIKMAPRYATYVFAQLAGPFFVVTCALVGAALLTQSLRFIDLIVNRGLDVNMFLYLTGLLAPSLLIVSLPAASFIAVTLVYRRLARDSELPAMAACGASPFGLAAPAAALGAVVACALYAVSLYALPASYRHFKDTQFLIRNRYAALLLQEGTFNSPSKDVTIYLDEYDPSGKVRGAFVYDNRNPSAPAAMTAREGKILRGENGPIFILRDGARQETKRDAGAANALYFEEYRLDLSAYNDDVADRKWREAEEYYVGEMRSLLKRRDLPEGLRKKLTGEMHFRLTWPAFAFLLTCSPLVALLGGEFNRRSGWKRMATACATAMAATAGDVAIKALVTNAPAWAWTPYAYLALLAALGFYMLRRAQKGC
ncbi:MAG: LptF/LptG family permease [Rickettsiales bacterium]